MELPFPGMDPYLEQPGLWPDVHHRLITAIGDQIQLRLSARYTAIITPYVLYESLEIAPNRWAVPDVGVVERAVQEQSSAYATATIAPAPLTLPATMEIPTRYARLEIRTVNDEALVTAIELLSPANKRPGTDGTETYDKKRREFFKSDAHLLEIDLLRNGRRPLLAQPLPSAPYFVFLSRAERRPMIEIWPIALDQALPVVPVPLLTPDPDIALDLTSAVHQIYQSARYDRRINYAAPPPAPDLAPAELAWLDAHLRERGARR